MNKKDKKEIQEIVNESLKQVVLPAFDDLHEEIMVIKDDVSVIKSTLDHMDRRLSSREDQLDRLGNKSDDHEKRIAKLERRNFN